MANDILILGFFSGLGPQEIILILLVALLVFGGRRLPELGKSLGKSIVEFKRGIHGIQDDIEQASEEKDKGKGNGTHSG